MVDAEERIATLAAEAASDRDYGLAQQLLSCARQLAVMSQRLGSRPPPDLAALPPDGETADVDGSEEDDGPAFERSGSDLVKMGKGGPDGRGYEHKAPKVVVDLLLRAVAEKSTKRGEFRTSRVFPLVNDDGRKVPGYQGYLALRWLRHIGLIQRVARQRYQMASDRDPVTSVDTAWRSLHERDL